MSSEHVTPNGLNSDAHPAASDGLPVRPRAIVAAEANEVMREQLEYLIEHAGSGICGCRQCNRYLLVRSLLMEIFADALRRTVNHTGGPFRSGLNV